MVTFDEFLVTQYLGNTGIDYVRAIIIVFVMIVALAIFKKIFISRLHKITQKTKNQLDDLLIDVLKNIHWPFYLFLALYVAAQSLVLPGVVSRVLSVIILISIIYYIVRGVLSFQNYIVAKIIAREDDTQHDEAVVYALSGLIKGIIWGVAILTILSNLGFDITTLVAGLGIGGLAIAFALQKVFEDLFASISIYFDKPFEVGDFIILGEHMGVVKRVGIKTTRIQALQGEEIVISNRELTSTRIQNYKRMEKRRIAFAFGVTYQTKNAKMEKIPGIVKKIFETLDKADLDRVHFKTFAGSSLDYEVVYYLKSSDYNVYMDTQQAFNMALKAAFEKEKIEFAYPTQTIFLEK